MEGDFPIVVEELIQLLISPTRSDYLGCRVELVTERHIRETEENGDIVLGHIFNASKSLSELVPLREAAELDRFKRRVKNDEETECTFFCLRGGWYQYGNNFGERRANSRGGLFTPVTSIQNQALA